MRYHSAEAGLMTGNAHGRRDRDHDARMCHEAAMFNAAIELAVAAHHGQHYPSPESEPYIEHALRVVRAVNGIRAQATAVLHDVLEDTSLTAEDLRRAGMPTEVVDAVMALTRSHGQPYEDYVEQIAGNTLARQVKLADLADNLSNNRRLARTPEVVARIERYEHAIRRLGG
jgi:(p)ppGpp synthase/HD superfamily hydrolase